MENGALVFPLFSSFCFITSLMRDNHLLGRKDSSSARSGSSAVARVDNRGCTRALMPVPHLTVHADDLVAGILLIFR